ncbi:pilus assembly PilX family protein [Aliamphritea hakodatensis]|uniref:pilus assembly PilX family protein n=1 Tax=Aliamphritea hakodatensis TaxID=2895352 RepID=UPI0022FDA5F6|nr:pilus assembly PilX N-terminal domain-containing protein [Aliamphritea hakodatensis]
MMKRYAEHPKRNQSGIVLVVTLLAIAMVSVLVTASVMTSSSEEKMAFNAHIAGQTFQAAESSLNEIVETDDAMFEAIDAGEGGSSSVQSFNMNINRLNSESFLLYQGKGIPVGYSLDSTISYKFQGDGRGYIDDNDTFGDADDEAATELVQGIYRISYVTEE